MRTIKRGRDHRSAKARGVIATFAYGKDDLRTLVGDSRAHAYALARRRWGDGWIGEPTFSTPNSIYRDVTGVTRREHGADLGATEKRPEDMRRRRLWREGRE